MNNSCPQKKWLYFQWIWPQRAVAVSMRFPLRYQKTERASNHYILQCVQKITKVLKVELWKSRDWRSLIPWVSSLYKHLKQTLNQKEEWIADIHAVFFIRKKSKCKLVMFLIFPKILYTFCFLVEEKRNFFVSQNSWVDLFYSFFLFCLKISHLHLINKLWNKFIRKITLKLPWPISIHFKFSIIIVS